MKKVEQQRSFPLSNIGNNPWSRMLMYFSALTFPSQTTSSERPAVQMAPQTITEKSPNLTVGCRCCKENSWDGSRHTQIRPLSENCANQDSSEKTTVSQNSTGLLIISDPHCFLRSMLKGQSGLFLAALPQYPRAWRWQTIVLGFFLTILATSTAVVKGSVDRSSSLGGSTFRLASGSVGLLLRFQLTWNVIGFQ